MCPAASHRKPSSVGSIGHNKLQNHSDSIKIIAQAPARSSPALKASSIVFISEAWLLTAEACLSHAYETLWF